MRFEFQGLVNDTTAFMAEPTKLEGEPWKVWQDGLKNAAAQSAAQVVAIHHEAGQRVWGHFGTSIQPLLDDRGAPTVNALALIVPLLGDAERRLLRLFGVALSPLPPMVGSEEDIECDS